MQDPRLGIQDRTSSIQYLSIGRLKSVPDRIPIIQNQLRSSLSSILLRTHEPIRQPENELGEDGDKHQDNDVAEQPR